MTVREITPSVDTDALLAGAQFADAFRIEVTDPALDARHAAERIMARQPRWAEALLQLRNFVVSPLGLKTSGEGAPASSASVSTVGVISWTVM